MELDAQGAGVWGEHFMGRFANACQDYDFYTLLDFYLSYRAWVRGKVACFVAGDPRCPAEKQRRKAGEARDLFTLARAFTRPGRGATGLIVVGGMIASGKSTLALELGRSLGVPAVSSDATRKFLAGLEPETRGGPELYDPEMSRRVYGELLRRAEVVLGSGRGVVLDASFARAADRRDAKDLASRQGVPFLFVETRAPEKVLRERLRARAGGPSVSDAREDLLEEFRQRFEPVREISPEERLAVDATGTPEEMLRSVLARRAPSRS
jgi:predicted kinase